MFCRNCGASADEGAQFCIRCGASFTAADPVPSDPATPQTPPPPPAWPPNIDPAPAGVLPKQKVVAAILAFVLGYFGVHRFYLGYHTVGICQLVLGLMGAVTCGVTTFAAWIWGIVDGVRILTGSIRTDAQGIPLRD